MHRCYVCLTCMPAGVGFRGLICMPYMYALYVLSPSLPISRFRSQSCKATHALAIEAHAFVIEASLSARGQRRNRIVGTFRCNSAIVHQKKTGARRAHCPPATSVRTAGRASAHANCPGLVNSAPPHSVGIQEFKDEILGWRAFERASSVGLGEEILG